MNKTLNSFKNAYYNTKQETTDRNKLSKEIEALPVNKQDKFKRLKSLANKKIK